MAVNTVKLDRETYKVLDRVARAIETNNKLKVAIYREQTKPEEIYDEETLAKVYDALRNTDLENGSRLGNTDVETLVNALQNAGILFRERA